MWIYIRDRQTDIVLHILGDDILNPLALELLFKTLIVIVVSNKKATGFSCYS